MDMDKFYDSIIDKRTHDICKVIEELETILQDLEFWRESLEDSDYDTASFITPIENAIEQLRRIE